MDEQTFLTLLGSGTPNFSWLLIAFGMGALTSLSPCVYPILPITIATLSQQSKHPIALRAALYCLGLATIYTALGAAAALTGQMFGTIASNPYIQIFFANLLLLFAFILKGWIPLPHFFQSPSGSTSRSAFMMGAASGLVAAPCSSPILAAILLFVAQQQSPIWGSSILLFFSLGMCLLLFVAGIFSGTISKLPRSGNWLNMIQWVMFLLLIGMSQFYLLQAGQLLVF